MGYADGRAPLTTIITTYRRPGLLARALESVVNQSFPPAEIIVADDSSGDSTPEVVQLYARSHPTVRYCGQLRNVGAVRNMNAALGQVRTEWCTFMADDDVLLPHCYESTFAAMTSASDAVAVAGVTMSIDGSGRRLGYRRPAAGTYGVPEGLMAMIQSGHLWLTSLVFRTDVAVDGGGISPETIAPDFDLSLRLATRGRILLFDDIVGLFVYWGENASSTFGWRDAYDSYMPMLRHLRQTRHLGEDDKTTAVGALVDSFRRYLRYGAVSAMANRRHSEATHVLALWRTWFPRDPLLPAAYAVHRALAHSARAGSLLTLLNEIRRWQAGAIAALRTSGKEPTFAPFLRLPGERDEPRPVGTGHSSARSTV